MKVLVITPFPPMNAPEADHALHLCRRLAEHKLDVHVVTLRGSITVDVPGMTVYPIIRKWSWPDSARLAMLMRRCAPEAVILIYVNWVYNYHPMITFASSMAKAFLPGVPFVTLFEDGYGSRPSQGSLLARAIRKGIIQWAGPVNVDYAFGTLLRDSDRVIVVSNKTRLLLEQSCPGVSNKSVLIPPPSIMSICQGENGKVRQLTRDALGITCHDFLLVYFGYIYPGKGLETCLKAFHIVRSQRSDVWLIIVGGSIQWPNRPFYMQELLRMAKELKIDERIIWTGGYPWDSDQASRYLHAADVCVLPYDGGVSVHNTSFAGAATHGLPVITTQGETLDPPFRHRDNLFLCPPKQPASLAAAIRTVCDDPLLRQRLRTGALQLAQEWFSWERAIDRTIETLSPM